VVAGSVILLLAAGAIGCEGFFVDPVLTSMAVGPQVTIEQGATVQMSAVGTYNDGSSSNISSSTYWSSSSPDIAQVSKSGMVTAMSPGQATITGSSGTVSGSTTVTVTLVGLTNIQVSPANFAVTGGTPVTYTATGTANGQQFDITSSVTWTSNNQNVVTFSGNIANTQSVQATTVVTIVATSGNIQGTATLRVNP